MKKLLPRIIVILVVIGLYGRVKGTYNNLVGLDEGVKQSRAQVENQYQRRADLIPNLVKSVAGLADQEYSTFTAVTEARAKATSTQVNIDNAESMAQFQQVQGELSAALSRLMVSVEAYPELKSNQGFMDLQQQLEGTENRIATERGRYNEVVKKYNTVVRIFPTNILANILGFDRAVLFVAEPGANQAPEINLDFSQREQLQPRAEGTIDDAIDAADAVVN